MAQCDRTPQWREEILPPDSAQWPIWNNRLTFKKFILIDNQELLITLNINKKITRKSIYTSIHSV